MKSVWKDSLWALVNSDGFLRNFTSKTISWLKKIIGRIMTKIIFSCSHNVHTSCVDGILHFYYLITFRVICNFSFFTIMFCLEISFITGYELQFSDMTIYTVRQWKSVSLYTTTIIISIINLSLINWLKF